MKYRKIIMPLLLILTLFTVSCAKQIEKITLTFFNWDNSLVKEVELEKGAVLGEEIKVENNLPNEAGYTYTFESWKEKYEEKTYSPVQLKDMSFDKSYIFNAQYSKTKNEVEKHKVTFKVNGEIYTVVEVIDGGYVYQISEPTFANNETENIKFLGWDFNFNNKIYCDTVIEAKLSITRTVKVTFLNDDDTIFFEKIIPFGQVPVLDKEPVKECLDAGYVYKFLGWDKPVTNVYQNTIYKPMFAKAKLYDIKFQYENGQIIEEKQVIQGEIPVCTATPTKSPQTGVDYDIEYEFSSWDKELEPAIKNQIYSAKFTENKVVDLKFENYNGYTLYTTTIPYGENAVYAGKTPVKNSYTSGNNIYKYTFTGWDKSLSNITKHTTFVAQFKETIESISGEALVKNHLMQNGTGQFNLVTISNTSVLGYSSGYFNMGHVLQSSVDGYVMTSRFMYNSSSVFCTFEYQIYNTTMYKATYNVEIRNHAYSYYWGLNTTINGLNYNQENTVKNMILYGSTNMINDVHNYLMRNNLPDIF